MKKEEEKKGYLEKAGKMYEELKTWREAHPGASIDEIGKEIRVRREKLMGELLVELAEQPGTSCGEEAVMCKTCGEKMAVKDNYTWTSTTITFTHQSQKVGRTKEISPSSPNLAIERPNGRIGDSPICQLGRYYGTKVSSRSSQAIYFSSIC